MYCLLTQLRVRHTDPDTNLLQTHTHHHEANRTTSMRNYT